MNQISNRCEGNRKEIGFGLPFLILFTVVAALSFFSMDSAYLVGRPVSLAESPTRLNVDQLTPVKYPLEGPQNPSGIVISKDGSNPKAAKMAGDQQTVTDLDRIFFRQNRTFSAGAITVSFLLLLGLLKLFLHLNHVTHGNYAGRLQFFGGVLALAVVIGCTVILMQNDFRPDPLAPVNARIVL